MLDHGRTISISDLGPELLAMVFDHLDNVADQVCLALTSKFLASVASSLVRVKVPSRHAVAFESYRSHLEICLRLRHEMWVDGKKRLCWYCGLWLPAEATRWNKIDGRWKPIRQVSLAPGSSRKTIAASFCPDCARAEKTIHSGRLHHFMKLAWGNNKANRDCQKSSWGPVRRLNAGEML